MSQHPTKKSLILTMEHQQEPVPVWSPLTVSNNDTLHVTHPDVPLSIDNLACWSNVLQEHHLEAIDGWLDHHPSRVEGYDGPRRRVWKIKKSSDTPFPDCFREVCDRVCRRNGTVPIDLIIVEEYTPAVVQLPVQNQPPSYDPTIMTTFAARTHASDNFVADLVLHGPAHTLVQAWNQPLDRHALAWKLQSEDAYTYVQVPPNTCVLRRRTMVDEWRTSRMLSTCKSPTPVRVLRVLHVPPPVPSILRDPFGYQPTQENLQLQEERSTQPAPPLKELLTVVVTTSPIKSHPSTEVLEKCLATFSFGGPAFLDCPVLIVCDGVKHSTSSKRSNAKQSMRNGIVNAQQLENYNLFKQNLRQWICDKSTVQMVELDQRHGYGFALKHAVQHEVTTPFVIVIQHDRTFMRPAPMDQVVAAMWRHPHIKYVGLSMRSNLLYRDIFYGKYGNVDEYDDMVLKVPELKVSSALYGPDSESTRVLYETLQSDKLRANMRALVETYKNGSMQNALMEDPIDGQLQMSLVPTLFWYDNVHICCRKHYADFVYDESYKMVARGGFVEDKLSPVLKRTMERLGLREGHSRFGCYLLDDHSGMFFTGHLDGGSYATAEQRARMRDSQNESK